MNKRNLSESESGDCPMQAKKLVANSSNEFEKFDSNVVKVDPIKRHWTSEMRVQESQVWITEFINEQGRPFSGELKQRYEDFVVHELNTDGSLVQLDSVELPNESSNAVQEPVDCDFLTEEIKKQLFELNQQTLALKSKHKNRKPTIPNESSDQAINDEDLVRESKAASPILVDATGWDKDKRTCLHRYLKQFSRLKSSTSNEGDQKMIRIEPGSSSNSVQNRWPESRPLYLHFTLYQENGGTFECVQKLARLLRVNAASFAYAGTKDKRSVSSQRMSVYKVSAQRLRSLNRTLIEQRPTMAVGNFAYESQPLRLGQTRGNRFELVLRSLRFERESDLHERMAGLRQKGFINYFGTQRFGMRSCPTHLVGAELLKQNWQAAVNLLLSERTCDLKARARGYTWSFNECIRRFKAGEDLKKTYEGFQWKSTPEGYVMKGLISQPTNFHQALFKIPRNSRLLYLHAFQSYVWNRLATFRIQRYGHAVVEGDLVLSTCNVVGKEIVSNDDNVDATQNDLDDKEDEPNESDQVEEDPCWTSDLNFNAAVRVVGADDLNRFSIEDVVIPLAGSNVQYPTNEVYDELKRALQQFDLDLDTFGSTTKSDGLYGAYRKLIVRPSSISYEVVTYYDEKQRLFRSDAQHIGLLKDDLPSIANVAIETEISKQHAFKVTFELPSSSYATICVRELMHQDL